MGVLFNLLAYHNMKVLLIVALAAVAMAEPEAEADPAVLYAGYYGYGLGGYYGYPGYYRGLVGGHSGYPYNYGWTDGPNNGLGPHLLGKREAEEEDAEPEAPKAVVGFAGYKHPLVSSMDFPTPKDGLMDPTTESEESLLPPLPPSLLMLIL